MVTKCFFVDIFCEKWSNLKQEKNIIIFVLYIGTGISEIAVKTCGVINWDIDLCYLLKLLLRKKGAFDYLI
jgi:hypothetical protein